MSRKKEIWVKSLYLNLNESYVNNYKFLYFHKLSGKVIFYNKGI